MTAAILLELHAVRIWTLGPGFELGTSFPNKLPPARRAINCSPCEPSSFSY